LVGSTIEPENNPIWSSALAAFSDPVLGGQLIRTREQFARAVQVMIVDKEIRVSGHLQQAR
jgi:hypothetical protein